MNPKVPTRSGWNDQSKNNQKNKTHQTGSDSTGTSVHDPLVNELMKRWKRILALQLGSLIYICTGSQRECVLGNKFIQLNKSKRSWVFAYTPNWVYSLQRTNSTALAGSSPGSLSFLSWPNNSWSQSQHFLNYLTAAKPDATAETRPIH